MMHSQLSTERSRIAVYDVIRAIALLLVVLGHSSYYTILTPFGGVDIMAMMQATGVADTDVHQAMETIVGAIYSFHMRVFFALSGAVFCLRLQQSAYDAAGVEDFLRKKARRLLMPFLLTAAIYAIPLKAIAGYWAASAHPVRDIVLGQFLLLGNSHLWFLAMLFGTFALVGVPLLASARLRRAFQTPHGRAAWAAALLVLLVLLVLCGTIAHLAQNRIHTEGGSWLLLVSALDNYSPLAWGTLWFLVGMLLERARSRVHLPAAAFPAAAIVLLGAFCLLTSYEQGLSLAPGKLPIVLDEARRLALAALGVLMTWMAAAALARTRIAGSRFLRALSRDSLGIYLFSDPLNYVLLAAFAAMCGPTGFGVPALSAALIAARFAFTLAGGWAVTCITRRLSRALQFL